MSTATIDAKGAATAYRQFSFTPIPVPFRSKRPDLDEWQKIRGDEGLAHFNGKPMNVGILLGEPSGGLLDVDCDCSQAVALAPVILPHSGSVFGRKSRRRAHYLYIGTPCVETAKFFDVRKDANGKQVMLVELRSTGCQTIFPPSVHVSGEPIEWDQCDNPEPIEGDFLRAHVAKLAAGSVLARHWPGEGTRHHAAMALAGGLVRGGWAVEDIESFVGHVARAAGDDEWEDRARAAKDTAENAGKTTGWKTLVGIIGADVVTAVQNWLGMKDDPQERIEAAIVKATREDPTMGPVLTPLGSVEPRDVAWLWNRKIALGKLTLVFGDPGLGKSFLSIALAAQVTTGAPMPDGSDGCLAGDVLMWSAEDDTADTIRPRADKAGADVSRIFVLEAIRLPSTNGKTIERSFTLADVEHLRTAAQRIPDLRMIVIDPVSAALGGKDGHRNDEIRGLLTPLAKLASELGVAVLLVSHMSKGSGTSAIYRAMGSLGFIAACRAAYLVVKDESNPKRRLFVPAKNNLGDDSTGMAYSLVDGAVAWERDPVQMDANAALQAIEGDSKYGPEPEERKAAAEWLVELLSNGPMETAAVKAEAKAAGHAWRTVQRAKTVAGARAYREQFGGVWMWKIIPKSVVPR